MAAELESLLEGDRCALRDTVGRERILQLCKDIRKGCERLDRPSMLAKLQHGFAAAAAGSKPPHSTQVASQEADPTTKTCSASPGLSGGAMPLLQVPRGRKPLSLWDWRAWPQAKPHLWCYGNAGNLYFDERLEQGLAARDTARAQQPAECERA